jgi:hypothetical protein
VEHRRQVVPNPAHAVLLCILFALAVAAPSGGADLGHYLDWASASLTGDIFELQGGILSPLGVPTSQWSPGPGLVFALGKVVLDGLVDVRGGALVIGALASLVFLGAMLLLLVRAASGEGRLVLLGAGAAFLGTHAGYCVQFHSSESLGCAAAALLGVLVTAAPRPLLREGLEWGTVSALLVLLRPQYFVYVAPVLGFGVFRALRAPRGRAGALALFLAPLLVVGLVNAFSNRWMTGSLLHSPLVFGDPGFRSFAWTRPEILAVLANPYHGLLVYHPLYALGGLAVTVAFVRSRSASERLVWAAVFVGVLAHLYVQSSWYVWWLGTLTFGMRGMSIAGVFLLPALVRALAGVRPALQAAWGALISALSVWSFLLLLRRETAFHDFRTILGAQREALGWLDALMLSTALLGALFLAFCLRNEVFRGSNGWASRILTLEGLGLGGLAVSYLFSRALRRIEQRGLEVLRFEALVLVLALGIASLTLLVRRRAALGGSALVALTILTASSVLFVHLAVRTEQRIARGTPPPRLFRAVSPVHLGQVREAYLEYLEIPGFKEEKAALQGFLERQGEAP